MNQPSHRHIVKNWIRNNPGVTLSFTVIAAISLSAFLYFFLTAR